MTKRILCILSFLSLLALPVLAQTDAEKAVKAAEEAAKKAELGWKKGGGLGLDMTGLGLVNPRLGAGTNNFGVGGQVELFASHKGAKSFWDNRGLLMLRTVRIGGNSKPFQKNTDVIRLTSRYGYAIIGDKIYAAIDALAESQILPTYTGFLLKGEESDLLSEFLSPARLQLSPGIAYRPSANLSFFVSPASFNLIYVGNTTLASLENQPLGNEAGKNNRTQVGYTLKAGYNDKYYKDRVAFSSNLIWFADYLSELNGNVLWQNTADIALFKGVSLTLFGEMFYDHFSQAQVRDVVNGVRIEDVKPADLAPYLGLKPTYRGSFLLKYSRIF